MYEYAASILRVVDGDTVHAEIDLGMDVRIRTMLRLAGINAPELRTPAGPPARAHLQSMLAAEGPVTVRTVKDKREKFGRYLAWVFKGAGPKSVNQLMIENGHAVAYNP